jgi:ABC-2 type transport system permease protein
MRDVLVVFKKEFKQYVFTKTYILGTILTPVIALLISAALPSLQELFESKSDQALKSTRPLLIIDMTQQYGQLLQELSEIVEQGLPQFILSQYNEVTEADKTALQEGEIIGYLTLSGDISEQILINSYSKKNITFEAESNFIEDLIIDDVIKESKLNLKEIRSLRARFMQGNIRINSRGEHVTSHVLLALVLILSFLSYAGVTVLGSSFLQGILNDKETRIIEVIFSSIHVRDYLLGKTLSLITAGLLYVAVVTFIPFIFAYQLFSKMPYHQQEEFLSIVPVEISILLLLPLFVLLTLLYYLIPFMICGAYSRSPEHAQLISIPLILISAALIFSAPFALNSTTSTLVTIGTYLPFTSPLFTSIRLILGSISSLGVAVSLVWNTGLIILFFHMSAKLIKKRMIIW